MESAPTCKDLAGSLGTLLISKGFTLSTAESCTGGLIGATVTSIPGSSAWFRGGIIAYDNTVKVGLLNVPQAILDTHGAVSEETVFFMAKGVAQNLKTDFSIAVTGIAGPDGGTEEKPVGLVYIGILCSKKVDVFTHIFHGDREQVREQTVSNSLGYLIEIASKV